MFIGSEGRGGPRPWAKLSAFWLRTITPTYEPWNDFSVAESFDARSRALLNRPTRRPRATHQRPHRLLTVPDAIPCHGDFATAGAAKIARLVIPSRIPHPRPKGSACSPSPSLDITFKDSLRETGYPMEAKIFNLISPRAFLGLIGTLLGFPELGACLASFGVI